LELRATSHGGVASAAGPITIAASTGSRMYRGLSSCCRNWFEISHCARTGRLTPTCVLPRLLALAVSVLAVSDAEYVAPRAILATPTTAARSVEDQKRHMLRSHATSARQRGADLPAPSVPHGLSEAGVLYLTGASGDEAGAQSTQSTARRPALPADSVEIPRVTARRGASAPGITPAGDHCEGDIASPLARSSREVTRCPERRVVGGSLFDRAERFQETAYGRHTSIAGTSRGLWPQPPGPPSGRFLGRPAIG
jgi:hypothetical protein